MEGAKYIDPVFFTRLLQHVPSLCAVCHGWGMSTVCATCTARFAAAVPRCERCALQVPAGVRSCGQCLVTPPGFDGALAGIDYAYPWSGLITQFKFHAALELRQALAAPLLEAEARRGAARPDLLLPAPLSAQRLRERGFNQAWEVTRAVARSLQVRSDAHLLLRVKHTPHQLAFPPDERAANVRGAFAVEPLRRDEVNGLRIAIVDDVMTTGATFSEMTRVLKQAGAAQVEAWAVARTPRPGQQ